jgi:hypothetical protein
VSKSAFKIAGATFLALAAFLAVIFLLTFLIVGTAFVAQKILPFLITVGDIALAMCIILLPLSLFYHTRAVALWGFFITSYVFGLGVWMYGFVVTYQLWGGAGIITGLVLAGVGVVPLGIAAAAINGIWYYVAELIFGLFVTYGTRAFALFLANSLERPVTNDELEIEVKPARLGRRRGVPVRAVQLLIKATAVAVAVFVGAFAANIAGWNGGVAVLGPEPYSTVAGALVNLTAGIIALSVSITVGYFIFRIAKWTLIFAVPIMLYSAMVAGLWNGIISDFDVTRGEVMRYRYANAYALRHMSVHAFNITCHDRQISLTDDAKALCSSTK